MAFEQWKKKNSGFDAWQRGNVAVAEPSAQPQRKWWEGGSSSDPAVLRTSQFIPGAAANLLKADVDKWAAPDWKSSIPDEKDWYYSKDKQAANITGFEKSQYRRRKLTGGIGRPFTAAHGDIHGVEAYIRSGAKPIGAKENIMRGDLLAKLPFSTVKAAEMLDVLGSVKRLEAEDFSRYTEAGIDTEKGKLRDQRVVDEYFKALQEQSVRGKTFMADVGSGVSDLPAWMVEFWVTGGMARLASKGATTAGLKFMGKYVKTQAGRHALANVLRVGAATVITPTIRTLQQPHRVVEGAVGNMIQGEQPITAWLKAGVSQNIENWSEAMGPYITKGLRASFVTKDVMRVFDDFAKARYIAQGGTGEAFGKAIKAGGYDGLIGELGEEWLGGMSQALLGTETFGAEQTGDFLKDTHARLDAAAITLLKQTPSMAATLAVPGAIKGGLDIAGRARQEPPPQPAPAQPVKPQAAKLPTTPAVTPPKVAKPQKGVQEVKAGFVGGIHDVVANPDVDIEMLDLQLDRLQGKLDKGKQITDNDIAQTELFKSTTPGYKAIRGEFQENPQGAIDHVRGALTQPPTAKITKPPNILQQRNIDALAAVLKAHPEADNPAGTTKIRMANPKGDVFHIFAKDVEEKLADEWTLAERPAEEAKQPPTEAKPTKAQRQHKTAVEQLFKKGKPVRQQYREMYPDLVAKYEKPAPTEAAKKVKEIEREQEAIIEPAPSPAVEPTKAGELVSDITPTGKLDPTDPADALEITEYHANWVANSSKFEPRGAWEGIYSTKREGKKRIIEVEYTSDQVDTAYRLVQKPIPSPMPDVSLFAMPGKEAELAAVAEKMRRQKPPKVGKKKFKVAKIRALPKTKTEKKDHIKAVNVATVKEVLEESRFALAGVFVEGENLVATDGRRMFIAKGEWGKDGIYLNQATLAKGILGKADKEAKYPKWQDIVPLVHKSDAIVVDDLDLMWRRVRQASIITSEESKGLIILVNKDGSLGFSAASPEVGHSEINVWPGAKILAGVNPQYLIDAIAFHATRGDTSIEFYFQEADRPILTRSPDGKTSTVLMPVEIGGVPEELEKTISEGLGAKKPAPKPTAEKGRAAIALAAETGKKTLYDKETPPEVQEFLRRKHNLAPLTVTKDTKDAANVMDGYFAEGDDQIAQAKVEGIRLQQRLVAAMKSRKFGPKQVQADMAIQVYIDLKNNPEQVEKYYSKLTDSQKALVDLAQDLPAELKAVADDIIKINNKIGLNALDKGVIGNVIENYSMRLWEDTTRKDRPMFRKFGTKTARAKHRTLEGILHGWSLGKKLKVKGATNAHVLMRIQVATTIVDRQLLKTAKQWGLISDQQLEGWVKIEHPNFTDWKWAGKAEGAKTYGKNFFVTEDGDLMERIPMYAEPGLGKWLNNALGTSRLYDIPGIRTLTEYNAILKRWILFSSFFHHQAYIRSYMLGGKTTLLNISPAKAYRAGRQAIENYTPEFQRGIRNGLTVGLMQDFDEVSRSKISVFGRMLNHVPVAGQLAKGINALRVKNEDWLFGKLGPYLKVQAYLLEYAGGVKKNKKALEAGTITLDDIAATAAKLANDDFGGLHLRRMGRNPTLQHIFRLLALAPDWTESNVRSAVKAFKLGEEGRVYRAFWARIAAKGLLAMLFFNYLMSLFDDEKDFVERYKEAWKNGKMRWMDIDITPLYRAMGGKADKQKYFSLFGHFKDPIKFVAREKFKEPALKDVPDPVRSLLKSAKYKGSVITRIFADGITGKDWKGSEFTTALELFGADDKGVYVTTRKGHYEKGDPKGGKLKGKLTKWSTGGVKPLGLEQVPSFLIYEARAATPIQIQNGIHYMLGQMDGFDAVLKGLGAYVSSTYDPAEKYQGKSVNELKMIRKDYVYVRTSRKLGQVKGKPHTGKERMVESLDKMIKEQR